MSNWRSERFKVFIFSASFCLCCLGQAAEASDSNAIIVNLHEAIKDYNTVEAIRIIQNASPEILNERIKGFSAIHLAAKKGFYEVVDEIIKKGGKIHIKNQDGHSAIYLAFFAGHDDIVRLLQSRHAKLEGDLFFQRLAITKDIPQHIKKRATDKQLRQILSTENCINVFMYAYPLIMDRNIVFEKIKEFLKDDVKFLQDINREEVVTKIQNDSFLKRINSRGYFSLKDFIDDKNGGKIKKSHKENRNSNKNKNPTPNDEIEKKTSQESFSSSSVDSKKICHECFSKESLSRTVSSATSSRDEINPKKTSSPSLSDDLDIKKSLSQSKDEHDLDEIISVEEFLEVAKSISMADIGLLKEKFIEHKPICNELLHDMLGEFVSAQFPAGGHSKAELKNLHLLLKKTKASSTLREKIWIALRNKQKKDDEIKKKQGQIKLLLPPEIKMKKKEALSELKTLWLANKTKQLAFLFTKKDASVLQEISLEHLYLHLDDKKPLAIKKCSTHTNTRINFFSYLVVSETDKEKRLSTVKKLLKLCEIFYKIHNLWSLSQVIIGLSKPDVYSLINWEKSKLLYKKFKFYEPLISMYDNFLPYHKEADSIPLHEPMLPNVIIVLHDIAMVQGANPTNYLAFLGLGKEISKFMGFIERSSGYKIDLIVPDTIKKIPFIDDKIIEEYSIAQKSDKEIIRPVSLEPMIKWSISELASFLYKEENSSATVLNLLNNFFWSGKDLIRFLSTAGNPKEMFSMLEKFGLNDGTRFFIVSEAVAYKEKKPMVVARRKTEQTRPTRPVSSTERIRKNKRPSWFESRDD